MASSDRVDGIFDADSEIVGYTSGQKEDRIPRYELRFFVQVFILYVVIITCLVNLSLGKNEHSGLWISLLSSSIGYLLPSPHIQRKNPVQRLPSARVSNDAS